MEERIVGAEVALRRWRSSDVHALTQIVESSLPHIAGFMTSAASEIEEPSRFFEPVEGAWKDDVVWAYAIERGDRVVGHITLRAEGGEIGYWIRVEDLGRGYATAAVTTVATAAFASIPSLATVTAACNDANVASRRVLEKAGFRLVDRRPWTPRTPQEANEELLFALERLRSN